MIDASYTVNGKIIRNNYVVIEGNNNSIITNVSLMIQYPIEQYFTCYYHKNNITDSRLRLDDHFVYYRISGGIIIFGIVLILLWWLAYSPNYEHTNLKFNDKINKDEI